MDLDDEFGDDLLDNLNDSTLQELENNAIRLTQSRHAAPPKPPPPAAPQAQYSEYSWDEDDDLDTSEVINNAEEPVGHRPVTGGMQPWQHAHRSIPNRPNSQWNTTADVVRRPGGAPVPPRQQLSGAVGGSSQAHLGSQLSQFHPPSHFNRPLQSSQFAKPPIPPNRLASSQHRPAPTGQTDASSLAELQKRVKTLESELYAARGEVSIIRANSTKTEQHHSAEVSRLKQINAEQLARQEVLLESARAAEKTASTELLFLQQDMREANTRTRQKDVAPTRAKLGGDATTPKKAVKTWGLADGFDDVEMVSPSKGQGRGRNSGTVAIDVGERTPTKGKRKRPAIDSPVMALDTHTEDVVMTIGKKSAAPVPAASQVLVPVAAPEAPFEFLQLILNHAAFHGDSPTFDVLSRFSFPADPSTSFATLLFQKLPAMGDPQKPMQLLVDFSEAILSLWTGCIDASFWEPVKYLVSLIEFTLQLQTTATTPLFIPRLVLVAQSTIFRLSELRQTLSDDELSKSEEYNILVQNIDSSRILALLYTAALSCVTYEPETGTEQTIVDFWQLMNLDFVTVVLTPRQPFQDAILVLNLLATSSLPGSIGPLLTDKEPEFVAKFVINRVSMKLTESSHSGITAEEKRRVRIAALRTLISFTQHPFGAIHLASHDHALTRVVACLNSAIDDLYDQYIPSSLFPSENDDDGAVRAASPSTQLNSIISQCVMLLHTLVIGKNTADIVNMSQKLSMSHGGSQRYLIALGRLTFAEEDLVMESGIESEIVEAAHELLEMAVTPDEGELVSEAFGA